MDYKMIENKVKEFCESEYKDAKRYSIMTPELIKNKRAIAYGAVHFATNNLFPCFNNELSDWWNDEMWHKFQKLIEKNS